MPRPMLKRIFWLFLVLFTLTSVAMRAIDSGLRDSITPNGIISFEFCAYTSSCDSALLEWGAKGQALAMLSLGLDYLYLILYPGLIAICLWLITPRLPHNVLRLTKFMASSCLITSLADAIENYALIQVILNESAKDYGMLGAIFATIKFGWLAITLLWLLFVWMRYVLFNKANNHQ